MPIFDTPDAISAHISNAAGEIALTATDTETTTVEVTAASERDQQAVAETLIDFQDGHLRIEVPRHHDWKRTPELDVRVTLPAHSAITVESASADVTCRGEYGDARLNTASGDVRLDVAHGPTHIETASGDIGVDESHGIVHISTASGDTRLGTAHDEVEVSTASGDVELGTIHGSLSISGASGDISLGEGHHDVSANSASGDISLALVHAGKVGVSTASGDVSVGVVGGTATWLDLHSLSGDIDTDQADDNGPTDGEDKLELRVNTVSGDIRVHRVR